MANSYTQFAFEFRINPKAVPWIKQLLEKARDLNGENTDDEEIQEVFPHWDNYQCLGFTWEFDTTVIRKREYPTLLISDDGGEGVADAVACFLQAYLKKHDPKKRIGFGFAMTSSPSRLNEFGGGACVVTAKRQTWTSTFDWLQKRLA